MKKQAQATVLKKPSYPKQMTIRYDEAQEKEIEQLQKRVDEKTMTKAFLRAPALIEQQAKEIELLRKQLQQEISKVRELSNIVNSWTVFTKKLEAFIEKDPATSMAASMDSYEVDDEDMSLLTEDEEDW